MNEDMKYKVDLYNRILQFLDASFGLIEMNAADTAVYNTFQEMLELLGVKKESFDEILKKYGFVGWDEFRLERKAKEPDTIRIEPIIGFLRGTTEGARDSIKRAINESNALVIHE